MSVTVLQREDFLIASVGHALSDEDVARLRSEIDQLMSSRSIRGVIIDASSVDLIDSFAARSLRELASGTRLRGAETVIAGIQPGVAMSMVQLGVRMPGVTTVRDLDDAFDRLERRR